MKYLTDGEMRTLYMDAADRRTAVRILADLTDSTQQDIMDWLEIKGYPMPYVYGDAERWALYKDGKTDKEIAQKVGLQKSTISYWRRRNGLAPNLRKPKNKPPRM